MASLNLAALRAVADRLDGLGLDYAFVGGAVVNLLLDIPDLAPARPTDDFDVILEAVTASRYSEVEARLRELGFDHDMREGAPRCRWVMGHLSVDIMPTEGTFLGLNTVWFAEALATASERAFGHVRLKLISPAAFLATKYAAFLDRGEGSFYASHDLEDFITVIDGREHIVAEIAAAPVALRGCVTEAVRTLLAAPAFNESLPGHLPGDEASQRRLPFLRRKLKAIAT
jgi:hypothetical protein